MGEIFLSVRPVVPPRGSPCERHRTRHQPGKAPRVWITGRLCGRRAGIWRSAGRNASADRFAAGRAANAAWCRCFLHSVIPAARIHRAAPLAGL